MFKLLILFHFFVQFTTETPAININVSPNTVLSQGTYTLSVVRQSSSGPLIDLPTTAILVFSMLQKDYKYTTSYLASNIQSSISIDGAAAQTYTSNFISDSNQIKLQIPNVLSTGNTNPGQFEITFTIENPVTSTDYVSYSFGIDDGTGNPAPDEYNDLISFQFATQNLDFASFTSSSSVVGFSFSQGFLNFSSLVRIPSGSYFTVTFPNWYSEDLYQTSGSSCTIQTSNINSGVQCTYSTSSKVLTVKNLFFNDIAPKDYVVIRINNMKNPPSSKDYGPIIITTMNSNVQTTSMSITQNIYITNVKSPGNLNILGFCSGSISSVISTQTSCSLNIVPSVALSISNTRLRISYDTDITIQFLPQSTSASVGSNIGFGADGRAFILLSNLPITATNQVSFAIFLFRITNSPYSKTAFYTISLENADNGGPFFINNVTLSYQINAGILIGNVTTVTQTQINQQSDYTFSLQNTNILIANSSLQIILPSQITISDGVLQCNAIQNIQNTVSCSSLNNIITVNSLFNANVPANTSFSLKINQFRNPLTCKPSDSFKIRTLRNGLLVDQIQTGVFVTSTPGLLDASFISLSISDLTVGHISSYSFSFKTKNQITIGGIIRIQLPSDIKIPFKNNSVAIILDNTISGTITIDFSNQPFYVDILHAFDLAPRPADSIISFQITLLQNPSSTKPTVPAILQTLTSDYYVIDQISQNSKLQINMTSPAKINNINIQANDASTGKSDVIFTFYITFNNTHKDGYILVLTFPTKIVFPPVPICQNVLGLVPNLQCTSVTKQSTGEIQLKMTLLFKDSIFPSDSTIAFSVSNITNYFRAETLNFAFQTLIDDQANAQIFYIEELLQTDIGTSFTFIPSNIKNSTVSGTPLIMTQISDIRIGFTPINQIYKDMQAIPSQILITFPPEVVVNNPTSSQCVFVSGIQSGTCSYFSPTRTYIINNAGILKEYIEIIFFNVTLGYTSTGQSSTFRIETRQNNFTIDQQISGLVLKAACNLPCKTCDAKNSSSCLSCFTTSDGALQILYDVATRYCHTICPNNKVVDNNICSICNSICKTCVNTPLQCTSCNNGYFLYGSNCSLSCPGGNYPDSVNNLCAACQPPCITCLSVSICESCNQTSLLPYFNKSYCVSSCQINVQVQIETPVKQCKACENHCYYCIGLTTTCTSCVTNYYLHQQQCLGVCPSQYFQINQVCAVCDQRCYNCDFKSDNCTSCTINSQNQTYLFDNKCITQCPFAMYGSKSNYVCTSCMSPCKTCSAADNCTTCDIGFNFFYKFYCYTSCPPGSLNIVGQCVTCESPCLTCKELITICSSCILGKVLYGIYCYDTCPDGYVNQQGVCQTCNSPCTTCKNTPTACTSCNSGYYLYGLSCLATCPETFYGTVDAVSLVNKCTQCVSPCMTCSSQLICQSCLQDSSNVNKLYINGICVSSCPSGVQVQQGNQCLNCNGGCSTCFNTEYNCTSCKSNYYTYNVNQCVQTCPDGTFINSGSCIGCISPCLTCSVNPTNCLTCFQGYYSSGNLCLNQCSSGSYPDNSTKTCKACFRFCLICSDNSICTKCDASSTNPILFNQQCVSSCPSDFPLVSSQGCAKCDESCLQCTGQATVCTNCKSGKYLYEKTCIEKCPVGFKIDISQGSNNVCSQISEQELQSGVTLYFPFLITSFIFFIINIVSKLKVRHSDLLCNTVATTSLFEMGLWAMFLYHFYIFSLEYPYIDITIPKYCTFGALGVHLLTNIIWYFLFQCKIAPEDNEFVTWAGTIATMWSKRLIGIISLILTFKFHRILLGRLFNKMIFSAKFATIDHIFRPLNTVSMLNYIFMSLPIIISCFIMVQKTQNQKNQLFYFSIELIVLEVLMMIFLSGDSQKDESYFKTEQDIAQLPERYAKVFSANESGNNSVTVQEKGSHRKFSQHDQTEGGQKKIKQRINYGYNDNHNPNNSQSGNQSFDNSQDMIVVHRGEGLKKQNNSSSPKHFEIIYDQKPNTNDYHNKNSQDQPMKSNLKKTSQNQSQISKQQQFQQQQQQSLNPSILNYYQQQQQQKQKKKKNSSTQKQYQSEKNPYTQQQPKQQSVIADEEEFKIDYNQKINLPNQNLEITPQKNEEDNFNNIQEIDSDGSNQSEDEIKSIHDLRQSLNKSKSFNSNIQNNEVSNNSKNFDQIQNSNDPLQNYNQIVLDSKDQSLYNSPKDLIDLNSKDTEKNLQTQPLQNDSKFNNSSQDISQILIPIKPVNNKINNDNNNNEDNNNNNINNQKSQLISQPMIQNNEYNKNNYTNQPQDQNKNRHSNIFQLEQSNLQPQQSQQQQSPEQTQFENDTKLQNSKLKNLLSHSTQYQQPIQPTNQEKQQEEQSYFQNQNLNNIQPESQLLEKGLEEEQKNNNEKPSNINTNRMNMPIIMDNPGFTDNENIQYDTVNTSDNTSRMRDQFDPFQLPSQYQDQGDISQDQNFQGNPQLKTDNSRQTNQFYDPHLQEQQDNNDHNQIINLTSDSENNLSALRPDNPNNEEQNKQNINLSQLQNNSQLLKQIAEQQPIQQQQQYEQQQQNQIQPHQQQQQISGQQLNESQIQQQKLSDKNEQLKNSQFIKQNNNSQQNINNNLPSQQVSELQIIHDQKDGSSNQNQSQQQIQYDPQSSQQQKSRYDGQSPFQEQQQQQFHKSMNLLPKNRGIDELKKSDKSFVRINTIQHDEDQEKINKQKQISMNNNYFGKQTPQGQDLEEQEGEEEEEEEQKQQQQQQQQQNKSPKQINKKQQQKKKLFPSKNNESLNSTDRKKQIISDNDDIISLDESNEMNNFIQDTPSNYNYLNQRFENVIQQNIQELIQNANQPALNLKEQVQTFKQQAMQEKSQKLNEPLYTLPDVNSKDNNSNFAVMDKNYIQQQNQNKTINFSETKPAIYSNNPNLMVPTNKKNNHLLDPIRESTNKNRQSMESDINSNSLNKQIKQQFLPQIENSNNRAVSPKPTRNSGVNASIDKKRNQSLESGAHQLNSTSYKQPKKNQQFFSNNQAEEISKLIELEQDKTNKEKPIQVKNLIKKQNTMNQTVSTTNKSSNNQIIKGITSNKTRQNDNQDIELLDENVLQPDSQQIGAEFTSGNKNIKLPKVSDADKVTGLKSIYLQKHDISSNKKKSENDNKKKKKTNQNNDINDISDLDAEMKEDYDKNF